MDPIYQTGTSVSAYVSYRASETLLERRAEARSQQSQTPNEKASNGSNDRLADLRDSIDIRTSETADTLLQYTDRVLEQADRIEQRIQSQLGNGGGQASGATASQSGAQFSMSSEMMSYLQMIPQPRSRQGIVRKFSRSDGCVS